MAVFRVNKTNDYTIMSNRHLKEKDMSLKAKGLLSLILSLPDDWDYSIEGLVSLCKENETAITTTLKELNQFGYIRIDKLFPNQTRSGRIEYIYNIFETPQFEKQEGKKQDLENLGLEIQDLENPPQLNTNILNTNESITNNDINKAKKPPKKHFGTYGRVLLTLAEYDRLSNEFGQAYIDNQINLVDEYIESNNNKNKYTNFNLVIRKSIRENWFNPNAKNNTNKRISSDPEWLKKYVANFESGVDDL